LTIYLDAVWMLNFLLDFMLLLLTQALLREQTKKLRVLMGAFVASLIVPITIYMPDSFVATGVGKLLYSLLIILCTFGFATIYRTAKQLLTFYFITFAIGGGLFSVHFLFQQPVEFAASGIVTMNSGYGDPVSWLFVLIGFPCIWKFTKTRMDKHAADKIRYDQLYPVEIQIKSESHTTTGFVDSGNQLVDPLTKKWVVLCDADFLKKWFTEAEFEQLKKAYNELDFEQIPEKWEGHIQFVPFTGAGGEGNFLFTVRPDYLLVFYGEEKIITKNVLIGIQFSHLEKEKSYQCLLQPQIIKLGGVHSAS